MHLTFFRQCVFQCNECSLRKYVGMLQWEARYESLQSIECDLACHGAKANTFGHSLEMTCLVMRNINGIPGLHVNVYGYSQKQWVKPTGNNFIKQWTFSCGEFIVCTVTVNIIFTYIRSKKQATRSYLVV